MAGGVFGNPITNSTLEGMPEFIGRTIQQEDRARVALNMKNAEGRDTAALHFVEVLRHECNVNVSTQCVIYNATGDTLTLLSHYDWYGHVGTAPYPIHIQNGQWGAFLHVKSNVLPSGSVGAVVYRGNKNPTGAKCDWTMAWSNPWNDVFFDNTVYSMVAEDGKIMNWNLIYEQLKASTTEHQSEWEGYLLRMDIGNSDTAVLQAICSLASI